MKKKYFLFVFLMLLAFTIKAQNNPRIQELGTKLDTLAKKIPGISKPVNLSISSAQLTVFLKAMASSNNLNISAEPNLQNITISQNFSDAIAKDVLLNLCNQYSLTIESIGNILVIKKYKAPFIAREIPVFYNTQKDLFSIDIQNDSLSAASRKITKITGKNVLFSIGLGNKKISALIKDMPFDAAIDKIALVNQLEVSKTKDGFYLFEDPNQKVARKRASRRLSGDFYYQIKDSINHIVEVDFINTPIESIINDIAYDLKLNMATSKPLKDIGKATMKINEISFNSLLDKLLEDTKFSYKFEDNMYFFGENELSSVTNVEVIPVMNRSIQMMMKPINGNDAFVNQTPINNTFSQTGNFNNNFNRNNLNQGRGVQTNTRQINNGNYEETDFFNDAEALQSIFPEGVAEDLKIKVDVEQNSFIVKGNALRIEKFKKFIKKIDKAIPLIMIEVMIIEVNKSNSVSAGIDLGIGDAPTTDIGSVFPSTDLALGAKSINRIIGGLNIGSLNIGRVVPNFYAKIQALETNGDLKIRSTPKLSALNGHLASLSNGERTFYVQRLINTIGVENPQTQEFENFIPIEANLAIKIRPVVSGDGSITLSIDVNQSSFSVSENSIEGAPPDISTRRFNSTVKVRDQDVVILGGLEVNSKSNSGSGVPFLARIPVIKWLFSKRVRTASKSKLSVLIRPSIVKN